MGRIYDICRWDDLRCHDTDLITFHDDQYRNSSNIKGVTLTMWEAIVLLMLARGISYIRRRDGLRWYDTYTKSHDRFGYSSNIKGITSIIWGAVVLILLMTGIYDVQHWDDLRWYDAYTPSFMKTDTDVQAIFRLYLWNFRCCNVGTIDGSALMIMPFRWLRVAPCTFFFCV
jgi:hypothetical protein